MAPSHSRKDRPPIAVCQDGQMPLALRHSCLSEPAAAGRCEIKPARMAPIPIAAGDHLGEQPSMRKTDQARDACNPARFGTAAPPRLLAHSVIICRIVNGRTLFLAVSNSISLTRSTLKIVPQPNGNSTRLKAGDQRRHCRVGPGSCTPNPSQNRT